GIRDKLVTGVQTCALPICAGRESPHAFAPGAWGLKLALRHRALLSDATRMPNESTVHACTVTKIERHGQGERSDVALAQVLRQEIGRASCRERVEVWEGEG